MESNDDKELVREFLIESFENLDHLELVKLESHPEDMKALDAIFRAQAGLQQGKNRARW